MVACQWNYLIELVSMPVHEQDATVRSTAKVMTRCRESSRAYRKSGVAYPYKIFTLRASRARGGRVATDNNNTSASYPTADTECISGVCGSGSRRREGQRRRRQRRKPRQRGPTTEPCAGMTLLRHRARRQRASGIRVYVPAEISELLVNALQRHCVILVV